MPKIFISYRREDSSYPSGIIASRLAAAFGKSSIILDIDNIPPGQDFREYIKHELGACDLLVAVIGKNWLTVRDESGRLRLENSSDWVRLELEAALGRESKIPVIPVLLDNVQPPKAEQLPESLRELAYRQAFPIRPPLDFDQDVEKLIQKIKGQEKARIRAPVGAATESRPQGAHWLRRPLVLGSAALVVAVAVLLAIFSFRKPSAARVDGQFEGVRVGQTRDDNGLETKLVWIPPGDFAMGSPKDEKDRNDDEDQVQVTLTKGFWLGQHEVTQAEWHRVMQTDPWSEKDNVKEGDNYPATFVSWEDAMNFCAKLTEQERTAGRLPAGWQYTLPTEAQWEYACRGGTKSRFSFGNNEADLAGYAWFVQNALDAGERFAHRVGQKKANASGFYDMHGNVWEWCRDWYGKQLPGGNDPHGPSAGSSRATRGGSWVSTARGCRSAVRGKDVPDYRGSYLGFRLAAVASGI